MAYITKPVAPKEDTNPTIKPPNLTGTGSAILGGSSTLTDTGAAPTNNAPTASGSFVNLQNYLDTNQPQATQLGQTVGNAIKQTGTDATNAVNTAKDTFNTAVTAGTPTINQGLVNKAIASPDSFTDTTDLGNWNKMLSGTYGGPQVADSTSTWEPATTAVNKAGATADLTKTAGGQTELLGQIAPTPYSQGGMSMNQMLLQNVEPARTAMTSAADSLAPLKDVMGNTLTEAGNTVTNAQQTAANTRSQLLNQVAGIPIANAAPATSGRMASMAAVPAGGALGQYQATINNKLEATRQEDQANMAIIDSIINGTGGAVTQSVANTLGRLGISQENLNNLTAQNAQVKAYGQSDLSGIQGQNFMPADSSSYLKAGDVTTAEDIAKYRALNNLIGNQGQDINLEKGVQNDSLAKAQNSINQQIQTFNGRQAAAAVAAPAVASQISSTLRAAGFRPSDGNTSRPFQPGEENNWSRSDGVTLGDLMVGNPAIANQALGIAASMINPVLGIAVKVLTLLGGDPAGWLGKITGITDPVGATVGPGETNNPNVMGGAGFDTGKWGMLTGTLNNAGGGVPAGSEGTSVGGSSSMGPGSGGMAGGTGAGSAQAGSLWGGGMSDGNSLSGFGPAAGDSATNSSDNSSSSSSSD